MIFDPRYLLFVGPAILLAIWAQVRVKSAFSKYSKVRTRSNLTGAEAAHAVLRSADIHDVTVEPVQGFLSDHYDPRTKTLRLSPDVYSGASVAAAGIAAHEAGHAIQHARHYAPLALRSFIVPVASIASNMALPLAFIGLVFQMAGLLYVGIILFSAAVLFQLVTLPVEFNASSRAKAALASSGIITDREEMEGVRTVLGAAAWTYVAAALTAIMTLLYLISRARD